jgi:hypothetical protein
LSSKCWDLTTQPPYLCSEPKAVRVCHQNAGTYLHNHHTCIYVASQCVIFVTHCVNLLDSKLILDNVFSADREFDVRSHWSLIGTCHSGTNVRQYRHFAERCFTCKLLRQETNDNSAVGWTDKQLNLKGSCRCPVRRRLSCSVWLDSL